MPNRFLQQICQILCVASFSCKNSSFLSSLKEQRSSGHAEDILVSFSFIFADKSRWNVIRCLDIVRFDCSHWIHWLVSERCVWKHDVRINRNVFSKNTRRTSVKFLSLRKIRGNGVCFCLRPRWPTSLRYAAGEERRVDPIRSPWPDDRRFRVPLHGQERRIFRNSLQRMRLYLRFRWPNGLVGSALSRVSHSADNLWRAVFVCTERVNRAVGKQWKRERG